MTPDFAERQFLDLKDIASEIIVGEVTGLKYEYKDQKISYITVILPLRQYKMILGSIKGYEDVFNKILDSFKFLE